jgi:hypothetical protein
VEEQQDHPRVQPRRGGQAEPVRIAVNGGGRGARGAGRLGAAAAARRARSPSRVRGGASSDGRRAVRAALDDLRRSSRSRERVEGDGRGARKARPRAAACGRGRARAASRESDTRRLSRRAASLRFESPGRSSWDSSSRPGTTRTKLGVVGHEAHGLPQHLDRGGKVLLSMSSWPDGSSASRASCGPRGRSRARPFRAPAPSRVELVVVQRPPLGVDRTSYASSSARTPRSALSRTSRGPRGGADPDGRAGCARSRPPRPSRGARPARTPSSS